MPPSDDYWSEELKLLSLALPEHGFHFVSLKNPNVSLKQASSIEYRISKVSTKLSVMRIEYPLTLVFHDESKC